MFIYAQLVVVILMSRQCLKHFANHYISVPIASSHWTSHLQPSAMGIHASTVHPVCVILGTAGKLSQGNRKCSS